MKRKERLKVASGKLDKQAILSQHNMAKCALAKAGRRWQIAPIIGDAFLICEGLSWLHFSPWSLVRTDYLGPLCKSHCLYSAYSFEFALRLASPRSSALHFRPPRISTQCRKLAQSTDCLIQPVWPRLRCILLLTRPEKGETNRISSESGKFLAFSSQLSILSRARVRDWETKIEKASSIVPFFLPV